MNATKMSAKGHFAVRFAWPLFLFATVAIGTSVAQAASTQLYVASNGADGAVCGAAEAPCRSISRAIAHAAPGDVIVVGPGIYGDIDRDGVLDPSGDSGEEAPVQVGDLQMPSVNINLAMIHIDKPLPSYPATVLARPSSCRTPSS